MKAIEIVVSVPDRRLSPNARVHWRTSHGQKKKARESAKYSAWDVLNGNEAPKWDKARVHVKAYFRDRRSKWDRDNFIASLKATIDGITDAGILANDRGLEWGTVDLSGINKDYPHVVLTFVRIKR